MTIDLNNAGSVYLTRREHFNAAHRLHSPHFSDEENRDMFGKCNYEFGHGHNYELFVTVKGHPDPKTGIIMNLVDMKEIMWDSVLEKVDHRHLNHDVPGFENIIPSAENMVIVFWEWLKEGFKARGFSPDLLHEIRLTETENNSVSYRG